MPLVFTTQGITVTAGSNTISHGLFANGVSVTPDIVLVAARSAFTTAPFLVSYNSAQISVALPATGTGTADVSAVKWHSIFGPN